MAKALHVVGCCGSSAVLAEATVVRAARADDLATLQALLTAAQLPVAGVAERFPNEYAVATVNDRVVGAIGIERYGKFGLLRSVVVAEQWRGREIGWTLVHESVQWAREQGIGELYLLTTTAADFFARAGFTEVERGSVPAVIQATSEFAEICPITATVMRLSLASGEEIRALVRRKYGQAAVTARTAKASCCGSAHAEWDPITSNLYEQTETAQLPTEAVLASLGCGNPTALAELKPGEVVLDLGSGGGIDVLLSARRVGPTGKAYGLDMTDEMLELARENQRKAGVANVEFLKGEIENIPLPDASVDVLISNCVINLSANKRRVLNEAFRVLKPNGRFAVSDIVVRGEMPAALRRNAELWAGCVAGALEENEYKQLLREAGFRDVDVEPTRIYGAEDATRLVTDAGLEAQPDIASQLDAKFMSAFVRATKP